MAEPLATTPIRYSFGADEHLFAEVSESMSLEAFFKGMAVTRAVERMALDGVLDVCLANASFQVRFDPDRIAPEALLEAVRGAEAQAVWPSVRCRRGSSRSRCCTTTPGPMKP